MKYFLILFLAMTTISCNQDKKEKTEDKKNEMIPVEPDGGIGDGALSIIDNYIASIEKAHKKEAFLKHKAVSFNINILFGGKPHLDGKVTMLTNSTKIRIDKKDESKLIYDGQKVFLCPEDANEKGARFDMFTWTYFFAMPYKLNDPGTKWELGNNRALDNVDHQTAKLTFEKGTGDAPDDWYVIYTDVNESTLKSAAYIVSFGSGGDTSKAEEDPHAVHYKDFQMIDGIPFATKWDFYGWNEEKGIYGDTIGEVTISDITFLDSESNLFETPENAKEIKL
ncbi:hypothetical protein D1816_09980 [Aquimarina sp. AD10]|uniref:DUF6503 family protein n=1 Tax=Aquimarina sp. AD10 TaxID=1714849 RepID=UPI000E549223|nr:DUF6503 family protein [Aquimarina sp. AD10]AXT60668.1 hypothetical protein D1816_09980 [Aquimarina sp. AD10]RKN01760.1 hypothetical protein D7033_03845 [Aquimarina sp. AD10]